MTTTSSMWRRNRPGPTTGPTEVSRARYTPNRVILTTTNTAVPARIAGSAELPVTWPPARVVQTSTPAARPIMWVPLLKATLEKGLRWARSYSSPEAAMTSAAAPAPAARARAKTNGVSTWMLGPRPFRLRGIDRNGATSTTMAPSGRLSRTRPRSTLAASRASTTRPIAETTAMYALSLPTIAQVSLVARLRGKQPIWWRGWSWHDAWHVMGMVRRSGVAVSEEPSAASRRRLVVRLLLAVVVVAVVYLWLLPKLV